MVYAVMGYGVAVIAYYDESHTFVDYQDTTGITYTPQWFELSKPNGASCFRFCNRNITLSDALVKCKKIVDITELETSVSILDNIANHIKNTQVVDLSVSNTGVVNLSGEMISGGVHSNVITLDRGKTITFHCYSSSVIAPIARYNGENNRYTPLVIGTGTKVEQTVSYTAIEDTPIILSWYSDKLANAVISQLYNIDTMDADIYNLKDVDYSAVVSRIICVGDSLTAGDFYPDQAAVSVGDNAKAFPYFLSKEMNIECINKGSSGATPITWFSRMYSPTVFDDYDCMLLWLGTNLGLSDTLDTDVEPYNDYMDYTGRTGHYCRIIEEFREKSDNAPIFLINCFDGGYDTESGITLETTNTVINKIATKYNLPVIDTSDLTYYWYTNPLYSKLRTEIHTDNTLHFSTFGNLYVAHKFHEFMRTWWSNNIDKMNHPYRTRGNGLPWWMEH